VGRYNANERSKDSACVCRLEGQPFAMSTSNTNRELVNSAPHDSRHDRRFAQILDFATEVFAEKGYEGASMRDLSRVSGISLAGLYYYFESKEKLLYFIQQHSFATILENLRERLATTSDPEARIRLFVQNHVDYSIAKQKAMKVLSHEDDVLHNGYGAELAAVKREYYRICVGLVNDLVKAEGLSAVGPHAISTRTAVMGLFGMLNWLYTWYKPKVDPDARVLAREMSDIFLGGIRCADTDSQALRERSSRNGEKRNREKKVAVRKTAAKPAQRGRNE